LIADQGTEAASRYGLERSLGVTLLLNRCSVESWDGRPRTTERLARQMLRLGLVGDYAVWANLVLAIGLAEQGRYDEAELEFQTANGLAARGAQESTLIDLGVEHARLGLIRGDWEEARSMLESARSAATAEPQPLAIISLEVCLVELDGAMARAAHRSGDDTTAATAVSRMLAAERRVRAVADVAATRSPGLDWRARAHLAVLDGLVRRGSGLPARAEWEATIVKLRELRAPGLEARAAAWLVEDLVEHSGDAELLGAALLSARAAAKRAEADGLLRDLDALETLSRGRAGPR